MMTLRTTCQLSQLLTYTVFTTPSLAMAVFFRKQRVFLELFGKQTLGSKLDSPNLYQTRAWDLLVA
jgi:hypothetical protein